MKCSDKSMRLYAVTGGKSPLPLPEQVRLAIQGGITFLQFREKNRTSAELAETARKLVPLCRKAGIPFVINDDPLAALESGANGVHIGQSDAALSEARCILGPDAVIGVSAHTVEEAVAAEKGGADYLGVGAMFATSTKADAEIVSVETLRAICSAVRIPVTAIGGIHAGNIAQLEGTGVDGVAIVSAIFSSSNIQQAAKDLREKSETYFSIQPPPSRRSPR